MRLSSNWVLLPLLLLFPGPSDGRKAEQASVASPIHLAKGPGIAACSGSCAEPCGAAPQDGPSPVFSTETRCLQPSVELAPIDGQHVLQFLYYGPDGELYIGSQDGWSFPGESGRFGRAWIGHRLAVRGEEAALRPGNWKLVLTLDAVTLAEMRFAMTELAGLDALAALPGLEDATPDLVGAVLEEAGKLASGVLAPLDSIGDRQGARLEKGGVVTPHAAFLAMMHEPDEAFTNLANLQADFDSYGAGGFFDAVAVGSGTVARRYLSLDQAMIMGALGNVLENDVLRRAFSTPEVESRLRPVIGMEEFGAGLVGA